MSPSKTYLVFKETGDQVATGFSHQEGQGSLQQLCQL